MKIVVVDGFTVNPGDLSWDEISKFGEFHVYDRTPENQILQRCQGAQIILTNKCVLNQATISELEDLRMISVLATGYNVLDIQAAKSKKIAVYNVPGYGTYSVAQHTIALILECTNHVGIHSEAVKRGEWALSDDWAYAKSSIVELKDKVLGIIGLGNIGRQVARIAEAMGMRILFTNPSAKEHEFAKQVSLSTLLAESDFVSLHCPLVESNFKFFNSELLNQMKSTAFLINTARGLLVDEVDLANALRKATIAGAALDVLAAEPPPVSNPLTGLDHCIITPHNAWMSKEARRRIIEITAMNISEFFQGKSTRRVI